MKRRTLPGTSLEVTEACLGTMTWGEQNSEAEAHAQLGIAGGYDHCWVLDADADCACELSSPDRDLTLTMSGGPGLQFYNGQFLARSHPHLGNGVILEPQGLPDAPNHSHFPDSILRPGEHYRAEIEYRVSA
jgi:aldose 1-epimerase